MKYAPLLALVIPLCVTAGNVYECESESGTRIYSDRPCEPGQVSETQQNDSSDEREDDWQPRNPQAAEIGMSRSELRDVAGEPTTINRTRTQHMEREQWVYRFGRTVYYIYVVDGVVTSIQD